MLVASQEVLLQTYVAERPPKPVTNPMFLIHNHVILTVISTIIAIKSLHENSHPVTALALGALPSTMAIVGL